MQIARPHQAQVDIDEESAQYDERHRKDRQIDERQRREHAPRRNIFIRDTNASVYHLNFQQIGAGRHHFIWLV